MIKLSDMEFQVLAWLRYGKVPIGFSPGPGSKTTSKYEQRLLDMELVKWKGVIIAPIKDGSPEGFREHTLVLECTRRGEEALHKNLLRLVLVLAELEVPEYYSPGFFNLVKQLSEEELPALLTHEKDLVRQVAAARMENRELYLHTPDTTEVG